MRVLFLILSALIASIAVARPDDKLSPGQRRMHRGFHDRVGWHLVNGVWMRASGQCEWRDLVRLHWDGSQLAIDPTPTNAAAGLLRGGRTAAVEVGIAKDLYQVAARDVPPHGVVPMVREPIALLPNERAAYINATELPEPDRIEHQRPLRPQTLVAAPRLLRVTAIGDIDGRSVQVMFFSQQSPARVQLTVNEVGKPESSVSFAIEATSLDELHQQNRVEVRKYLSPLMRVLMGPNAPDLFAPGAADVYTVFAELQPGAEATAAVNALLPQMLDASYDARMAAVNSLRKLGPAGVCAIARLSRNRLAPQQASFIEQVLTESSRRADHPDDPATDPAKLRDDPIFLIDCLEFSDDRVRAAAISELTRVLNRELNANAADARACARLANELREQIRR